MIAFGSAFYCTDDGRYTTKDTIYLNIDDWWGHHTESDCPDEAMPAQQEEVCYVTCDDYDAYDELIGCTDNISTHKNHIQHKARDAIPHNVSPAAGVGAESPSEQSCGFTI